MNRILLVGLSLILSFISNAQEILVSGSVTDGVTGESLPGVSIVEKGTTNGTSSDFDGNYTITVQEGATLEFSFIGYKTQTVIADQETINVVLSEDVTALTEVVVVGYGTQKSKDLTSAITTVQADELVKTPAATATQALQGKVGGLQVVSAGAPGDQPVVRVRGIGSFQSQGQGPLYVVDGMFYSNIDFLNSNEIESISVLKDASAAAIYGVRAANGVIIIKTKSGKKDASTIEYDSYYGIQYAQNVLKMANAEQFTNMAMESGFTTDYQNILNAMQKFGRSRVNPNVPDVNTDWYANILRPAPIQSHSINGRGGSEKITYSLGTSYFRQDGIMDVENYYERFNLNAKVDVQAKDWLKLGGNIIFSNADKVSANGNTWKSAYHAVPVLPVYDEDFKGISWPENFADARLLGYRDHQNPMPEMLYNDYLLEIMKINANFYAQFDIIKDKLNFKTSYNRSYSNLKNRELNKPYYMNNDWFREYYTEAEGETIEFRDDFAKLTKRSEQYSSIIIDNVLSYNDQFGEHGLSLMAGSSYREETFHALWGSSEDIPWDKEQYWYIDAAKSIDSQLTGDGGSKYYGLSYFGRASYNYASKYILYATLRADGTNKFEETWATFPAFGAGWVISEEAFFEDIEAVNYLKLRAGWGQLGNDNIPRSDGSSATEVVYVPLGDDRYTGTVTSNNINILHWELTEETNVGISANMFNSRLGVEADYYVRDTKDAAIYVNTPVIMGGGLKSVGVIRNSGFELALNWNDKINDDINYWAGVTLSTNKNKVINLYGQDYIDGGTPEFLQRTMVGAPLMAFYGWKVDGVYQTVEEVNADPVAVQNGLEPGDFKYKDLNNDGSIDDQDRTVLGSYFPNFMYGANFGISYKGLSFTTNIMGQSGNKILNRKRGEVIWTNDTNWDADLAVNRWHGEGTSNTYPSSKGLRKSWNQKMSDYLVEDGAFFRIQNITVAYQLQNDKIFGVDMPETTISFTAERPFTHFTYNGFNPEVGNGIDNQVYPIPAIYSVGLNVKF